MYDNAGQISQLMIQPYRSGIQLVQPEQGGDNLLHELYRSSISTYFMSTDSRCKYVNDGAAMLCGADSAQDLIERDALTMWDRESAEKMIACDQHVMTSEVLHITDDSGTRSADEIFQQMITFKMPWYENEKVCGVFGMTLKLDSRSLAEFTNNLQLVTATGLLRGQALSALQMLNQPSGQTSYFSKREQEVLFLLLKSCTARQIAEKLKLSKRTVEHHVENIKLKANCRNKYELFEKYYWQLKSNTHLN